MKGSEADKGSPCCRRPKSSGAGQCGNRKPTENRKKRTLRHSESISFKMTPSTALSFVLTIRITLCSYSPP